MFIPFILPGLFVFAGLFVLPPALVFIDGVGVLMVVGVVVVVVVVFVVFVILPALFVFSLAQPIPKALTASKLRRAKVLRIELSPVTQRVRWLGVESESAVSTGNAFATTRSIT